MSLLISAYKPVHARTMCDNLKIQLQIRYVAWPITTLIIWGEYTVEYFVHKSV